MSQINRSNSKKLFFGTLAIGALGSLMAFIYQKNFQKKKARIPQRNAHKKQNRSLAFYQWDHAEESHSYEEVIMIKDKEELKKKLTQLNQGGIQELQIVSDFDYTITPFKHKGEYQPSCFGALRRSSSIPQEVCNGMAALFKKYYPYEQDHSIPYEEKKKIMQQWNDEVSELYKQYQVSEEVIQQAISQGNFATRYAFQQFITNCYNINLPFYIISGGTDSILYSILQAIIDVNSYHNLFIHSNEFKVNEQGYVELDMKVNTTSKHEFLSPANHYHFHENAILLGDSNHDIKMAENMNCKTIINILFLNESQAEDIDEFFKSGWDIIIRNPHGQQQAGFTLPSVFINYISKGDFEFPLKKECEMIIQKENYKEIMQILKDLN